jgi:hypothetical protein
MPTLTGTEKGHWKERLARRIDKRMELLTAHAPGLMERIRDQARQRAVHALGLAVIQAELDTLRAQK